MDIGKEMLCFQILKSIAKLCTKLAVSYWANIRRVLRQYDLSKIIDCNSVIILLHLLSACLPPQCMAALEININNNIVYSQ